MMRWLTQLRLRFRSLFLAAQVEQELDEELRYHLERQIEEGMAAGLDPETARYAAMRAMGAPARSKEECRDMRGVRFIEDLVHDLRYGLRMLRRNPAFTAVAVLILALGIGANSAIFAVVNAVILQPLPYTHPDRLAVVWERNTAIGKNKDPVAPLNYSDWTRLNTEFEDMAAFRYGVFTLTGMEYPEQVQALTVTSSLFRTLGVEPAIGRAFTEEEAQKRDRVVVLSHSFLHNRLGGDRSWIGRSITLDETSYMVLGVMPPSFEFPEGGSAIDLYSPLIFNQGDLIGRRSHSLTVIGRLKRHATIESAAANLESIAKAIARQDSTSNPEVAVFGAHDQIVQHVRLGLAVLLGASGFVLLIACANVANLLLARAAARRREIAVRTALGASPWRIARQLLTESLLLSLTGGIAGMLFAWWTLDLFVQFSPPDLPRMNRVAMDSSVLLFVTALSALTGILFGLAPALEASRENLSLAIKERSFDLSGPTRSYGRSMLVVAEVALSLMLVVGAGLMIRTLLHLQEMDHGFRPEQVLTMQIWLPTSRYPIDHAQFRPAPPPGSPPVPPSKSATFVAELIDRVRNLPGVQAAGAVSALPLNPVGIDYDMPVLIEGKPRPKPGQEPQADLRIATTGYFRTMSIPLLGGRDFTEFDDAKGTPVIIVNDTMSRQFFPGENPIGRRVLLYGRPREIIGVVGSVRHRGFNEGARPEMILPHRQFQLGGMTLAVRSSVHPTALATSIKKEVLAMDPAQTINRNRTMEEFISESMARSSFTTLLLGSFAALAMILALVGIYGVMSYSVTRRTHEIGVRMALGADRRDVIRMVVYEGMGLASVGVMTGLAGAAALTRLLESLLFGVTRTDPATFIFAAVVLLSAALAAIYLPARRATQVDPMEALRQE
jgi:putative ABC transport system permease protein